MKKKPRELKHLDKVKKHFLRQWGTCPLCGISLEKEFIELTKWFLARLEKSSPEMKRNRININYDHIIPKSKGGKNKHSNYQLTHAKCNLLKGNNF